MNPRRRSRLLFVLAGAAAAIGLFTAALLPGPSEPPSPGPGFGAGPVAPGTPVTPEWAEVADVVPGIEPGADNACQAGRVSCLDVVIAEMEARFELRPCAQTAPFAFTYLEMTREVRRRVADPGFFAAPEVLAQLDTLFARLYFDAFDNWAAGRHDEVPGAWQLAFGAADEGRTGAAADIFLGMNAHISRDLAYAVAEVIGAGLVDLDDPTDYVLVNEVIADVQDPMLAGAAARFDPRLSTLPSVVPAGTGLDSVDMISLWRDQAFELGLRLATAETDAERAAVEAEIERAAVAGAVMILNADASNPVDGGFDRDTYCEENAGSH